MADFPFDKSFDPKADIDLSLFAHIHNDPFIDGAYQLEGNRFERTMGYLDKYLQSLVKQQPEMSAFKERVSKLVEIETKLNKIKEKAEVQAKQDLKLLSEDIAKDVINLPIDSYLSLPGGWVQEDIGGHAMVYQFKHTKDGYIFFIHNSGSGLRRYHERQSAKDKELYAPVIAYHIPSTVDPKKLGGFIRELMLPQLPSLRAEDEQYFNAERLYEEVIPRIEFLDAEFIPNASQKFLTAGQLSGTCTQRSLHQMLKDNFATLQDYQRFIYGFKSFALEDYLNKLESKNLLWDKRVQKLIRSAIKTMGRMLNIPGLFTEEEKLRLQAELVNHKNKLAGIVAREQARVDRVLHPRKTQTEFYLYYLVRSLNLRCNQAVSTPPKDESFTATLHGGPGLFKELEEIIKDCQRLVQGGQYLALIEKLELIFTQFPLPSAKEGFNYSLSFYTDITPENQKQFYDRLAEMENLYCDACTKIGGEATALPRMLVAGLSIFSVLDYVRNQHWPREEQKRTFHDVTAVILGEFFSRNLSNAYYATNNPKLDERLISIRSFYSTKPAYSNVLMEHYLALLNTEPELKKRLLVYYESDKPKHPQDDRTLQNFGLRELYAFINNFEKFRGDKDFEPLIKLFDLENQLEQMGFRAIHAFWGSNSKLDKPPRIYFDENHSLFITSAGITMCNTSQSTSILNNKYKLSDKSASQRALAMGYNYPKEKVYKARSDNHIQMFPAELAVATYQNMSEETKSQLAERQIDSLEMANRELFHLRTCPQHQIKLTLEHFQKHLAKLADKDYQIYLEANLFEPGLLSAELANNPDLILNKLDHFIETGLKYYAKNGLTSQTSLFFIRIAYLLANYAASYRPDLYYSRLNTLKQRISGLLQIDEHNDTTIKLSLHQYQFLTAVAQLKLNPNGPLSTLQKRELLERGLSSYFFINAHDNPNALLDTASSFDLNCARRAFKCFIMEQFQSDRVAITALIPQLIEKLGLGECEGLPTYVNSVFNIKTKQGEQYKVDLHRGLVFNNRGLAHTPVPIDILNHPVMRYLDVKTLEPCFSSSDGLVFELGSDLRFVRKSKDKKYRVQKKWMVGGHEDWYELQDLSLEQYFALNLDTESISIAPLNTLLKQRENHVWISCKEINHLLITENQKPAYLCKTLTYEQCVAKQLDKQGLENGYVLCLGNTWLHDYFSEMEDPKFITVCEDSKNNRFQIKLGRYGLTLLAVYEKNKWVIKLENNPSSILINLADKMIPGVAGLVFEDVKSKQRSCYLPLQAFISAEKASESSEFYQLVQDKSAEIPPKMIEELSKTAMLLPWQYSGTEQFLRYQLDQDGSPIAASPYEALYLCYLYLANHQPEQAWAVLEDCGRRFGGMEGSYEELSMLNWIINYLPYPLKAEHEKAKISTPAFLACQLKAIALLTSTFRPDKIIKFPAKNFDLTTPEGLFQDQCYDKVKGFHDGLNTTIYKLYSRFQFMRRHLEHGFYLNDEEQKSLLNYYHYNLPGAEPKAVGALGYEWKVMELKALRKEEEILKAQAKIKGQLPAAYQKRLTEIGKLLEKETLVYAHHTELELVDIDLEIPTRARFPSKKTKALAGIQSWVEDIRNAPIGTSEIQAAMDALTPTISEQELLQHFPCYYHMLINPNKQPSPNVKVILDFCQQYLRATRHVPLQKQRNKISYLCNILYRIGSNSSRVDRKIVEFLDILKAAEAFPAKIEIYQASHKKTAVLAKTATILDDLQHEMLTPGKRMIATSSPEMRGFSVEELINTSKLSKETISNLLRDGQRYREQAIIFGVAPQTNSAKHQTGEKQDTALQALIQIVNTKLEQRDNREQWLAELEEGKEQYDALHAMKQIAGQMLAEPGTRQVLLNKSRDLIKTLKNKLETDLAAILRLARQGPEDKDAKLRRNIEIESGVRPLLDLESLLTLYFKADQTSYVVETGLSLADIQKLHTQLSHYVAFSVRQQSLERFCKELVDAGSAPDLSSMQKIAHELLTVDLVKYNTEPALALLQYRENILFRQQQKDAITRLLESPDNYSYKEGIEKIIMGGGKSKAVIPAIAKEKATGSNLVVIEVPAALFNTNYKDFSDTSQRLYNQKAHPFEFNRISNCSPESLEFQYNKLRNIIVNKDYLVTTGESVQSLELKYYELLLAYPDNPEQQTVWYQQIYWLDKILTLFRKQADAVMDEVHQALALKKKLNYTLGEKHSLSKTIINDCVELYQFLDKVQLNNILEGKFAGKSIASLLENNKLVSEEKDWTAVMDCLTVALLGDPRSPLQFILTKMELDETKKHDLLRYLSNQGTEVPPWILGSDDKLRTTLAVYKEQLSQLLPETLKRKLYEHYGDSKQRPEEGIAIPYIANNVPSERSRFGNFLEAINYTIQLLMIRGLTPALLKQYVQMMQEEARQELLKEPEKGRIDNTVTAHVFRTCTGQSLSEINVSDDQQFNTVFKALAKNKQLISEVLKSEILPKITIESEVLHSDAYNHVDIYRSCQGLTGTPFNSNTYHQRLSYKKETAAATDGFIINLLREKKTPVRQVANSSVDEFLRGLFDSNETHRSVRAIIDVCASFQGISNLEVSTMLANYIRVHPDKFSVPEPIQYILYFNEENLLCALSINEGSEPIEIGSTDPKIINAKLNCLPEARFSYYDQSHTIGIDLKQGSRAELLVLADEKTSWSQFSQGCLRGRDLQNEQQLEIITPTNFAIANFDALVVHVIGNEERQLQKENFSAAQAKMTNLIRANFMDRILALEGSDLAQLAKKKHDYALAFKDYFVERAAKDFFELYGNVSVLRPAEKILEEQFNRLIEDWEKILISIGEPVDEQNVATMASKLNAIIQSSLPHCQQLYLSPTQQEQGKEVEVQKQVQIEKQSEYQLQKELYQASPEPNPYRPIDANHIEWKYTPDDNYLTLTKLCKDCNPNAPDFAEIYLSPNYYKSYKNQTQFIGHYLKPVHSLFFRKRRNGDLDCLILSQQEAQELTRILKKNPLNGYWIGTTQHSVLAGNPPEGILNDKDYQAMIEQIRFFNGDLRLLLERDIPLNWLGEETKKKLEFFEQNLLPYRETEHKDLQILSKSLSQRLAAFRYIAEHPQHDYKNFDWQHKISQELSEEDIIECQDLAQAYAAVNKHWLDKDFNKTDCFKGLRLSMQASDYVTQYSDQLLYLKELISLTSANENLLENKDKINSILSKLSPVIINGQIPNDVFKRQSIFLHLFKRINEIEYQDVLLEFASKLIDAGANFNGVDADGNSAFSYLLSGPKGRTFEIASWLLKQGALPLVQESEWLQFTQSQLDEFFELPVLRDNEAFLKAYLSYVIYDSKKLETIVSCCQKSSAVLQKIITDVAKPTLELCHAFAANILFITNKGLVEQLTNKLEGPEHQSFIAYLRGLDNLSPNILEFLLEKSGNLKLNEQITAFEKNKDRLDKNLLIAFIGKLPRDFRMSTSNIGVLPKLLKKIINNKIADASIFAEAANYAMLLPPFFVADFWKDFSLKPWHQLDAAVLQAIFIKLPDSIITDFINSEIFKTNQESIIENLLKSNDPEIYKKLLENELIALSAKQLLHFPSVLDQHKFPQLIRYKTANQALWNKVLSISHFPSIELLEAILENDRFNLDGDLLKPFINSQNPAIYKALVLNRKIKLNNTNLLRMMGNLNPMNVQSLLPIIVCHPAVDHPVLHQVIRLMKEPIDDLFNLLLANKRFTEDVSLIKQLLAKVNPGLGQIVLRGLVNLNQIHPSVLELVIEKSSKDDPNLVDTVFDKHKQQLDVWLNFSPTIVCNMFLELPDATLNKFLDLQSFKSNPNQVIDKLLASKDVRIYSRLLQNKDINLQTEHLRKLLNSPNQDIFELIVLRSEANEEILREMINVLQDPSDALFRAFVANEQFVNNESLINLLYNKLIFEDYECLKNLLREKQNKEKIPEPIEGPRSPSRFPEEEIPSPRPPVEETPPPRPPVIKTPEPIVSPIVSPKPPLKPTSRNYSFFLKCLAGIAIVAGGALLVLGILIVESAMLIAGGAALIGVGAVGLFSSKSKKEKDGPIDHGKGSIHHRGGAA